MAEMNDIFGKYEGGLVITTMTPPAGIEVIPSSTGDTDPVFFMGIFSFYPTCAVGVAYYPQTHEFASEPFFIDLAAEDVVEPSKDWVNAFLRELDMCISPDGSFGIPMYSFYYEGGTHPEIPHEP